MSLSCQYMGRSAQSGGISGAPAGGAVLAEDLVGPAGQELDVEVVVLVDDVQRVGALGGQLDVDLAARGIARPEAPAARRPQQRDGDLVGRVAAVRADAVADPQRHAAPSLVDALEA